jgi:hypothetical protein
MADGAKPRRTRVERGIYRQQNGNFAVYARRSGRLHFRTVGADLEAARRAREELIVALSPSGYGSRLRFGEQCAAQITSVDGPSLLVAHRTA